MKTHVVDAHSDFGPEATPDLVSARALVAFCTSQIGDMATSTSETSALTYAYEHSHELDLIPVQMCEVWPPVLSGQEGGNLCDFAFGPSCIRVEGSYLDEEGSRHDLKPQQVAENLYRHMQTLGILEEVSMSSKDPRSAISRKSCLVQGSQVLWAALFRDCRARFHRAHSLVSSLVGGLLPALINLNTTHPISPIDLINPAYALRRKP